MKRSACNLFLMSLLIGCGTQAAVPEKVVSVGGMISEANGSNVTIDLRHDNIEYVVDRGVDISGVTLICPNSQSMPFAAWVMERSLEFNANFENETFSVLKGEPVGSNNNTAPLSDNIWCPEGCCPCTDGGCICGGQCGIALE